MRTFVFVLILSASSVASEAMRPIVGSISQNPPKQFSVYWTFGIEQWEQGRRSTFRDQLWHLVCSSPRSLLGQHETECSVERTVVQYLTVDRKKRAFVAVHDHWMSDGTLELVTADWSKGRLDFNLMHTDGSKIEVLVRLTYKGNTIYLESFQAIGIARGILSDSLAAIEYRIPQYTHTVQVPIELPGYRTEDDRLLDELLASLAPGDRKLWERSMEIVLTAASDLDSLRSAIPDLSDIDSGKRKLTSNDVSKLQKYYSTRLRSELAKAGISAAAGEKLTTFYTERLMEAFADVGSDSER